MPDQATPSTPSITPPSPLGLLEPLLMTLYDGVTASNGFQDFLAAFARTFNVAAMSLFIQHRETHEMKGLWLHGITPEWAERYALNYVQDDMLAQHVMGAPIGHFYASNLDVPQPELIPQTSFYREWVVPQGFASGAGAVILREGAWFTQSFLLRAAGQPPYTREELARLDALVPHLQRALQMRERFAALQASRDVLAGGLDVLAMPTILFDEHSRVAHMNRRAVQLLADGKVLRLEARHLVAVDGDASRRLNFEISNAIRVSRGEMIALNEVVLVPRSGKMPLMLMVAPVRLGGGQGHGAALMFAFDPQAAPGLTTGRIRKLFGLTETEAALAVALCSGKTLDDVARERSVAPSTVKTHLKHVFSKTGANRQTELVSLLLASPAYFLADGGQAEQ
ncbi:helix-turn-helix transcriptional regulator [Noviherbaspirillum sedimenti]|nr:helix-turn-helix transcriptional regulator [Noviherbaspirillum sedimenti]